MKQGLFTVLGLSLIALFVTLSPAPASAEEAAPAQENTTAPAPAEEAAPAPENNPAPEAQPQQPAPEQAPAPQPPVDNTWKEKLEQKYVEFIEWLQQNFPDKAKDLLADRDKKPEEFVQKLTEVMKIYEPIQRADRYYPELGAALRKELELQAQLNQLIIDIGRAAPEDRPALIARLRENVSARFDNIIEKKQLMYNHLHNRLEVLQKRLEGQAKELEQLKADKEKSIEQRMKELIEQNEKINWK